MQSLLGPTMRLWVPRLVEGRWEVDPHLCGVNPSKTTFRPKKTLASIPMLTNSPISLFPRTRAHLSLLLTNSSRSPSRRGLESILGRQAAVTDTQNPAVAWFWTLVYKVISKLLVGKRSTIRVPQPDANCGSQDTGVCWLEEEPSRSPGGGLLSLGPCGNKFQARTLETGTVTRYDVSWSQDGGVSGRAWEGSKWNDGSGVKAWLRVVDAKPRIPMLE